MEYKETNLHEQALYSYKFLGYVLNFEMAFSMSDQSVKISVPNILRLNSELEKKTKSV